MDKSAFLQLITAHLQLICSSFQCKRSSFAIPWGADGAERGGQGDVGVIPTDLVGVHNLDIISHRYNGENL